MNDQKAVQKFLNEGGISEESFLAGCDHVRKEIESKLAEAVKYLKRIATNFDCSAGRDCESRQEYKCESCIAREALEKIEGKEKQ